MFLTSCRARPEVLPWGNPGELSLHWFGLTDGKYWIQAGDDALLEYGG